MRLSSIRRSIFALLFISNVICLPLTAQRNLETEVPRFSLSATKVAIDQMPPLFWLDTGFDDQGEPTQEFKELDIAYNRRGRAAEVPVGAQVSIYRKTNSDQANEPEMLPVLQVPAAKKGDRWLLVFHRDRTGKVTPRFIDDSPAAHPAGTVRFANFIDRRTAVSIGSSPQMIQPGKVQSLGEPTLRPDGRFGFKLAYPLDNGELWATPLKYRRLSSDETRMLVILTNQVERTGSTETITENEEADVQTTLVPVSLNFYDRVSAE